MTNTFFAVVDSAGEFKKSNRFHTGEFDSQRDAESFRTSLPNQDDYTVQSFIEETEQTFHIVVGNIGTVYSGNDSTEANRIFDLYKQLSIDGYGRVTSEPVTLMRDNEPWIEYEGCSPLADSSY